MDNNFALTAPWSKQTIIQLCLKSRSPGSHGSSSFHIIPHFRAMFFLVGQRTICVGSAWNNHSSTQVYCSRASVKPRHADGLWCVLRAPMAGFPQPGSFQSNGIWDDLATIFRSSLGKTVGNMFCLRWVKQMKDNQRISKVHGNVNRYRPPYSWRGWRG